MLWSNKFLVEHLFYQQFFVEHNYVEYISVKHSFCQKFVCGIFENFFRTYLESWSQPNRTTWRAAILKPFEVLPASITTTECNIERRVRHSLVKQYFCRIYFWQTVFGEYFWQIFLWNILCRIFFGKTHIFQSFFESNIFLSDKFLRSYFMSNQCF